MLQLQGITKRFGDLLALDGVSLGVEPGTVHGLLGENGAGKTTLMRIAAGLLRADTGTAAINGVTLPPGSPVDAIRAGVAMVHQHFMLVPTLTVTENFLLGRRDQGQLIDREQTAKQIEQIADRTGLTVHPGALIESLGVGQQQRVEILRALSVADKVLILDEPTAVLTPQETEQLFAAIGRLRREGLGVVFISHKLDEVERICDHLTILRHGRRVWDGPAGRLSREEMTRAMVGHTIDTLPPHDPPPADTPLVLDVRDVTAELPGTHRRIERVNLQVRRGEIVGVAGVEGNGQDVLAAAVVGMTRPESGTIELSSQDVSTASIRKRAAIGLAHIAEDRLADALVPTLSLQENLLLKDRGRFSRKGLISWRAVRAHAVERLRQFNVRASSPLDEARHLSGGNQQKLVLARELGGSPALIVAHNPVRGLDVAATRFVFEQLLEQRGRGAGILLIHNDLDELLAVSDRIVVINRGRLIPSPLRERRAIGHLMLGGAP